MSGSERKGRRRFLTGAGAAGLVVVGGGLWRAREQGVFGAGEGPAYEAWRGWRGPGRRDPAALVRAAVLAASPHNTQPWLFRVGPAAIELLADPSRHIGAIDPFLREMQVGLGCALENLLIAAEAEGFVARPALLPDAAAPTLVARVELGPAEPRASPLFEAIPRRHTNRGPFDAQALGDEALAALGALGRDIEDVQVSFLQGEPARRLGALIVEATEAIVADEEQLKDSSAWFRHRWRDVQAHRDGLTLDAMALPPLIGFAAKMLPYSPRRFHEGWLRATRDLHVATAPAFGVITVPSAKDEAQRVRGGRLFQRMHLWCAANGLAVHPMSQLTERADREAQLRLAPRFGTALAETAGAAGRDVLMIFRLGRPLVEARPSPRRPADSVIV